MAPRSPLEILRRPEEFRAVYRGGAAIRRRWVEICYWRRAGGVRLGMTVSRKVGNAVVRNRLRRRIRDFARLQPRDLQAVDLVVQCRPGAGELSGEVLRGELEQLWRELKRRLA
ncbi:MAG: ribonuclease P protein component [Nitrospirae bacterium CG18_big_fil_WC_8_21_14_2_50_70_55]|nr:ribonuclease P protein component [Deltaproteobacteria bacterium]PIQ05597.1 MAG: ribonuclease P protein component [Nitrospirae bacterium CG18_big_fil_WC_8_21_14_2_50_70_55]PIU77666.1 MAG: ribonuclease P protein component [Nitrospirae bacterium CG06_land_8_20_14_3_00_70_43]PIW81790.1 MAG: ribonuclease P protein component [Nitrospirae bacterium CG_4_8_14_3_um_filter_70_85]PIX84070.1 MAG: ribonuclease P protein component [Nitrospirae bacterium CG_4_10_14_3_um_filter_70_108]PJB95951.1 MAG: ribon